MIFIDAEGYDANVILGLSQTLVAGHVRYIEFEVSKGWDAQGSTLARIIGFLDNLNFDCFWAMNGRKGLWRITGCWDESYRSPRVWSNVACVNRNDTVWWPIMNGLDRSSVHNKTDLDQIDKHARMHIAKENEYMSTVVQREFKEHNVERTERLLHQLNSSGAKVPVHLKTTAELQLLSLKQILAATDPDPTEMKTRNAALFKTSKSLWELWLGRDRSGSGAKYTPFH